MITFFLRSPLENIISKNDDGLFPWREIVEAAHAQNALVFLAHPYAPARERPRDLWQELDGIEVYNARIAHSRIEHANDDARSTCLLLNKPYSAGSDGHFAGEVGAAFIELECENTLSSVRAALLSKTARVYGGAACSLYRPASQWIKMCDRH
ncbi:MAG: PHP-associated domain-containing protein, partial [Oscillospiraceae bacterium]